jgi:hypothetical protein
VGVTRAKNKLNCFSFGEDSTFVRELLGKTEVRAHPVTSRKGRQEAVRQTVPYGSFLKTKQTKRKVTEDEYLDKLEEIRTTGILWHKVFGEGRVLAIDGDTIRVEFPGKTTMCRLKYMMEQGILTDGSSPM